MTETEAIRTRYARRRSSPPDKLIHEERNRTVEALLPRLGSNRKNIQVLDVGCGNGRVLKHLLTLGFESPNLTGIDLLPERIDAARRVLPSAVTLYCGDATAPEFDSQNANLVLAFTVFTSILDSSNRKILADRLWSATRMRGAILVYDFCVPNPFNKDVRPLTPRQVRSLFPSATIHVQRLTVAPPLARIHPGLYKPLSRIPFLQTHRLYWLEKPAA